MNDERRPVLADPVPGHMYVDTTPTGEVVFTSINQDDDMRTTVIFMDPATAAKLGQIFINAGSKIEPQ